MSRPAIAAVLARDDLTSGERLVVLSLASLADRTNRAWPGTPAASARAGLGRSRYLQARDQLVGRGLVVIDERATGRGRSSAMSLPFADAGPWWDGEINVNLVEAVLGYSAARGPARLLLETLAAVAATDVSSGTCRPSSWAPRLGSPTGPTGGRGRSCSRRESCRSSAASAVAGTRMSGRCVICAGMSPSRAAPRGGLRRRQVPARSSPR